MTTYKLKKTGNIKVTVRGYKHVPISPVHDPITRVINNTFNKGFAEKALTYITSVWMVALALYWVMNTPM